MMLKKRVADCVLCIYFDSGIGFRLGLLLFQRKI